MAVQYLVAEAGEALGRGLGLVVQGRARGAQLIELPQVLQKQQLNEERKISQVKCVNTIWI